MTDHILINQWEWRKCPVCGLEKLVNIIPSMRKKWFKCKRCGTRVKI